MIELLSPVGRLVQGDAFTPSQKKDDDQNLVFDEKGQPVMQYYEALAIEKTNPEWPAYKAAMEAEARAGFPQYFNLATGQLNPGVTLSYKITDGDGFDKYGKSNALKEGFAGCWVVKFSTQIAPKVMHKGKYLNDTAAIKRGYYIRVYAQVKANIGSKTPGNYVNQLCTELIGYGTEIQGGADYTEKMTAPVSYVPAGMLAAPLPPTGAAGFSPPPPIAGPGGGLPTPPVTHMPPPPPPPPVAQPAGPQPAGPQPAGPQPAGPQPAFTMTALAGAYTREQYLSQGYTDDMLIAQGLMVKSAPPPNPAFTQMPPPPPPPVVPSGPRMTAAAGGATYEQMRGAGWSDQQMVDAGMMTR